MLLNVKTEYYVSDIFEFVREFNAEALFEEETGKSIDDWDFEEFDSEVIERMLGRMPKRYFVHYDERSEGFLIWEFG